jgi:hypothetical protein
MNELHLITIYCVIDEFLAAIQPLLELTGPKTTSPKSTRKPGLSMGEIMTILICFQKSGFRNFKFYYLYGDLKPLFPKMPSYSRFVTLAPRAMLFLFAFLQSMLGNCTGLQLIDSTPLIVCDIHRASSHKTFKDLAKKGKTSMGWFFGFKLHVVINDHGEILAYMLTPGNVDDRKPVLQLSQDLFGKLIGDRGYISKQLFDDLFAKGIQLITRLKSTMKNKLMEISDRLLLRRRGLIETVFDSLKNDCHLEHTRHRSPKNFIINILGALTAYSLSPKKPSLRTNSQGEPLQNALCI